MSPTAIRPELCFALSNIHEILTIAARSGRCHCSLMTAESDPSPSVSTEETITPAQQAIRQRALRTIATQLEQPVRSRKQRLTIVAMTLGALLVFLLLVNFFISGMQRILDIWYPGSISGRNAQPAEPPPLRPGEPFYITVDPPLEDSGAQSSANTTTSASQSAHQ